MLYSCCCFLTCTLISIKWQYKGRQREIPNWRLVGLFREGNCLHLFSCFCLYVEDGLHPWAGMAVSNRGWNLCGWHSQIRPLNLFQVIFCRAFWNSGLIFFFTYIIVRVCVCQNIKAVCNTRDMLFKTQIGVCTLLSESLFASLVSQILRVIEQYLALYIDPSPNHSMLVKYCQELTSWAHLVSHFNRTTFERRVIRRDKKSLCYNGYGTFQCSF